MGVERFAARARRDVAGATTRCAAYGAGLQGRAGRILDKAVASLQSGIKEHGVQD